MLLNLPEPSFYTSHVIPLFLNPQRDSIISKAKSNVSGAACKVLRGPGPDHRATASLIPHTHPEMYILSILKSCTLHSDSCWSLLKLFLNLGWQSNIGVATQHCFLPLKSQLKFPLLPEAFSCLPDSITGPPVAALLTSILHL